MHAQAEADDSFLSVNAIILINTIDRTCVWIIRRSFSSLPDYKEHIELNNRIRVWNTIAVHLFDEHMIS